MRITYIVVAVLAFVGCHSTPSGSQNAISVTAAPVREANDYALRFEVRNGSDEPLVVIDRFLPWGGNAANWGENPALAMKATVSGRELQKLYPVRELGPDTRTIIAPGTTAAGTLRLSHYFADAAAALDRHQTIRVDWTYRLKPIDRGELVFHGTTDVPR
jgi:hypothetical protein